MVRDREAWRRWEARWQRATRNQPEENMRIFWTLLEMARAAGAWPPKNPLEGIETDVQLARKVNTYVQPPGTSGQSPG